MTEREREKVSERERERGGRERRRKKKKKKKKRKKEKKEGRERDREGNRIKQLTKYSAPNVQSNVPIGGLPGKCQDWTLGFKGKLKLAVNLWYALVRHVHFI